MNDAERRETSGNGISRLEQNSKTQRRKHEQMKIINKTHWHTADISKIIRRCARIELDEMSRERRKRIIVTVVYARNNWATSGQWSSGHAQLGGFRMTIRIGKHRPDKIDFAKVCVHEMAHLRGLSHDRMNGKAKYDRVDGHRELYAWAEEMQLRTADEIRRTKPKRDVQTVRYERTLKNIKNWETKLKRATNALKKLRTTRRYYERAFAAKGISKSTEEQ